MCYWGEIMKSKMNHSGFVFVIVGLLFFIPVQCTFHLFAQEMSPCDAFAYMENYEVNKWQVIENVPFPVKFFTGNIEKELIIFGGYGNHQGAFLIELTNYQWTTIADASFDVMGSCGDNAFGPIIFGGNENR